MQENFLQEAQKMKEKHGRKRRWLKVVSALACVVVFCTVYALILPAITLEAEAPKLNCTLRVHQHTEECYDEDGVLLCGEADFVVHTHTADCYDAEKKLVCELEEIEAHEHTEDCYQIVQKLVCGLDEGENHTHDENCYESVQELTCGKEEIILHQHTEECYDEDGTLICGQTQVLEHVHGDECFLQERTESDETEADSANLISNEVLTASNVVASGNCGQNGTNVTWTLTDDGVLTLSGTGNTHNYNGSSNVPGFASYRTQVRSIIIESGVNRIGNWIFSGYAALTKVEIQDGLTEIGGSAFRDCAALSDVSIPSSVTVLGDGSFYGTGIAKIEIPYGTTRVGNDAFGSCSNLISVTIPDSVKDIGGGAFGSCSNLTSVTIPDGVKSIGDGAFRNCTSLTAFTVGEDNAAFTVVDGVLFNKDMTELLAYPTGKEGASYTIPNTVTNIKPYAFYNCSQLTEITIPNSVTSVGNYAFYGCSGLTELTIPEGAAIGTNAFYGCTGLAKITIPNTATSIADYAFYGCSNLTEITIPNTVTSIGKYAFCGCSGLTEIAIPEGVKRIGNCAFQSCTGLTKIVIPDGMTEIEASTFAGCKGLTEAIIPGGVTSIGDYAFQSCTGLTEIVIPDGVTSISRCAFNNCTSLANVTFGEDSKLISLSSAVFRGCSSLKEIKLPNRLQTIGNEAFQNTGLTSVVIPDSVQTVGSKAFLACKSLKSVVIGSGVTNLGNSVFQETSITSFVIPGNVQTMGYDLCWSCTNLKTVKIEHGVTSIGNSAFANCFRLTTVEIPETVTSVGTTAFYNNTSLTEISLPDSVTSIGSSAFENDISLASITIPRDVTSIENAAFRKCTALSEVTLRAGSCSTIGTNIFNGCTSLTSAVIGREVGTLSADFLSSGSFSNIRFEGENEFTLTGSCTLGNIALTGGSYYVDAQGVLYRLNDGNTTAELVYCPAGLETYTVPAAVISNQYTVAAVAPYALSRAEDLTALTFESIGAITELPTMALGACPTLNRVNDQTTISGVLELFTGAKPVALALYDTAIWKNSQESGTSGIQVTENEIQQTAAGGTKVTLSTNKYAALTGESVTSTISISPGENEEQTPWVRVYFLFDSENGGINYSLGTFTLDEKFQVNICAADIPNVYYLEFKPISSGDTLSMNVESLYQNIISGGGTALVWTSLLSAEEINAVGNGVTVPDQAHQIAWRTQRSEFTVTKKGGAAATIAGDGTENGEVTIRSLGYSIAMTRNGNALSNGKDHMISVDFVDKLTLPEDFHWRDGLIDAIQAGNWRFGIPYTTTGNSAAGTFYVTVGDVEYTLCTLNYCASHDSFNRDGYLSVDDGGNILIGWTYYNLKSANTEINMPTSTLTIGDSVIVGDKDAIQKKADQSTGTISYVITNTVDACQHYTYSGTNIVSSKVDKTFNVGAATIAISKTGAKNANGTAVTRLTMGEEDLFTIRLSNLGSGTLSSILPVDSMDHLEDELPDYFCISSENLEKMFFEDEFGKLLSVTISNATLCTPKSVAVTATDRGKYTLSQQMAGAEALYNGLTETDEHAQQATLTIAWSEDGQHLLLTGSSGADVVEIPKGGIGAALDRVGYLVTKDTKYKVTWNLTDKILYSGQSLDFYVRATVKDTFMRLEADQGNYIIDNTIYQSGIKNRASIHMLDGTSKHADTGSVTLLRDFTLSKSAYMGSEPVNPSTAIESGDVLTYINTVTHSGSAAYDALPVVDHMKGGQLLLASVTDNPQLAEQGLGTLELDDGAYYILNKPGEYKNVMVGGYLADKVVITEISTGLDTMIYWYLTEITGAVNVSLCYQSLFDPIQAGLDPSDNYDLENEVWLNNHPSHRLYGAAFAYGTSLRMDKSIITARGSSPEYDAVDDRTTIGAGDQVTYRLMLQTAGSGMITVKGSDLKDVLPASLNNYWNQTTVKVAYVTGSGSVQISDETEDGWNIETDAENPQQQYLLWKDDFSVTIQGTLYIYVTLTYPSGSNWADYCHSFGGGLTNTFYVYHLSDEVFHDLSIEAEAVLQKGVYFTGIISRANSEMLKPNVGEDSRFYYSNDGQDYGMVTYYTSLYNGGDSRLYLSEIQDVLPQGFTYFRLYVNEGKTLYRDYNGNSDNYRNYTNIGYYDTMVSVVDSAEVAYKQAYIETSTSTNENGRQVVTFSLGNSEKYGGNLSYDEALDKYYLNPGEAVVFAYYCRTNAYANSEDTATNVVSMPYYDYNGAGAKLDSDAVITGGAYQNTSRNDGDRRLANQGQAAQLGVNTSAWSGTTQWLTSDVTVHRGNIVPGITKIAGSVFAGSEDVIDWTATATNSGADVIRDYTLTDVMMEPYRFVGDVTYSLNYDDNNGIHANSTLFTFDEWSEDGTQVPITGASGNTVTLTVGAEPVSIASSLTVYYDNRYPRNISINLFVSLAQDEDGSMQLSIRFPDDVTGIAAGGSGKLTVHTRNRTNNWANTMYVNKCYITPTQQFDVAGINQGNYTRYNDQDSVVCDASIVVSYTFATSSSKSVTELNADFTETDNSATALGASNYIVLSDASHPFRYTLTVDNTVNTASKAIDMFVLIDNLPEKNDHTTFYDSIARYSDFRVKLANSDFKVVVTNESGEKTNLASESYTLQFSEKTEFGDGDWNGTSVDGWVNASNLEDQRLSLDDIRSFRIIIKEGAEIPANSKISVSFDACIDGDALPSMVAWNSFGYHYRLKGESTEMEAAPQKVGVKIASVPSLEKNLADPYGNAYPADENAAFRFLIYEGTALSLSDDYTTDDVLRGLNDEKRSFTIVDLSVKAGETASENISLDRLFCWVYENEGLSKGDEAWTWRNLQKYTILELPQPDDSIYTFGSFNSTRPNNYTFTYNAATALSLTCTNVRNLWDLQVFKQDEAAEPLSGAVFGLYSGEAADRISDDIYSKLTAELSTKPAHEVTVDGTAWYLMDIQTTGENGSVQWSKLTEERYYLLELQPPAGYSLNAESGQVVANPSGTGTVAVTVTNTAGYILPESGGAGNALFTSGGLLLIGCSLLYGYRMRRRRERREGD